MLDDPRARRTWRLFRLRAELMLSAVSPNVRRNLLEDLTVHMRDILADDTSGATEFERLKSALSRIGDPKEFLAPLLADAVFRDPPRNAGLFAVVRSLLVYAMRGGQFLLVAASILALTCVGLATLIVSIGSIVAPDRIGAFYTSPDTIQVRLLGLSVADGSQMLSPIAALAVALLGAILLALAWRRARRMIVELLAPGS